MGREFYIILQGECAFYQKYPEKSRDIIKEQLIKEVEGLNLEEIPTGVSRTKSSYEGKRW